MACTRADNAMRKALQQFFPHLANMRLTDFKVRVVNVREGTAAKVRPGRDDR